MPKRKALAMLVAAVFIAAFFAMPALAMVEERPAADERDNAQTMSLHPPVYALLQDGQRFFSVDRLPRRTLGRLLAQPMALMGLSPVSYPIGTARPDPPAPPVRGLCTPLGALAPPAL